MLAARFFANCCVTLRELLPPKPGKSINLFKKKKKKLLCQMWQKKRDFKRPARIKNYKGPNIIKPCYRKIYHK